MSGWPRRGGWPEGRAGPSQPYRPVLHERDRSPAARVPAVYEVADPVVGGTKGGAAVVAGVVAGPGDAVDAALPHPATIPITSPLTSQRFIGVVPSLTVVEESLGAAGPGHSATRCHCCGSSRPTSQSSLVTLPVVGSYGSVRAGNR
jgi:hypothetical protein